MQNYCPKFLNIRIRNVISFSKYSVIEEYNKAKSTDINDIIDPRVRDIKNKLVYSDYLNNKKLKFGYKNNIKIKRRLDYKFQKIQEENEATPISSALKYLNSNINADLKVDNNSEQDEEISQIRKPIHMPYSSIDSYQNVPIVEKSDLRLDEELKVIQENYSKITENETDNNSNDHVRYDKGNFNCKSETFLNKIPSIPSNWMTDYEVYDDSLQDDFETVNYGTPNPNSEVSSIPCGGCGALLHCKDQALPGYLPSELFLNKDDNELKNLICQRCHFMKNYNTCLDVNVSADEYPKLLKQIQKDPKAAVLLLIDLTDFPCSIWPKLPSIIGEKRWVFIIGNKLDLLPKDSPNFIENVKECLRESLIQSGIVKTNIKHISLVSAKTGYGIEDLITKLHKMWNYRSDVYLIGCTNSGKSTLFNTLLKSDFCKSQAVDLVQRATTSAWPGTTLNLLKFPILKPTSQRLFERFKRLTKDKKLEKFRNLENIQKFKKTKDFKLVTLQGRISHTFKQKAELRDTLSQLEHTDLPTINSPTKFGLDENDEIYRLSKWCYDTPGTIQPDQVLHLLTTDELLKTLPDKVISPRTFCLWPDQTIFIAGLGRLDILKASHFLRCTVFASNFLPITICEEKDAQTVYDELIKSEALVVPTNDPDRLKLWPALKSKDLETTGSGKTFSCADVVLSSAGWISITGEQDDKILLRAWTPEGRGIYLRTPALLPKSVTLRGMRKVGTPAYQLGRQIFVSNRK